jgi:hypothetical protein
MTGVDGRERPLLMGKVRPNKRVEPRVALFFSIT